MHLVVFLENLVNYFMPFEFQNQLSLRKDIQNRVFQVLDFRVDETNKRVKGLESGNVLSSVILDCSYDLVIGVGARYLEIFLWEFKEQLLKKRVQLRNHCFLIASLNVLATRKILHVDILSINPLGVLIFKLTDQFEN